MRLHLFSQPLQVLHEPARECSCRADLAIRASEGLGQRVLPGWLRNEEEIALNGPAIDCFSLARCALHWAVTGTGHNHQQCSLLSAVSRDGGFNFGCKTASRQLDAPSLATQSQVFSQASAMTFSQPFARFIAQGLLLPGKLYTFEQHSSGHVQIFQWNI